MSDRKRPTRADTKAAVIAAAARVFDRDGFSGAEMEAVAKEAGLTKGAVYSNFRTKLELLLAVLDIRSETLLASISDIASQSRDVPTAAQAIGRTLQENSTRQPSWVPLWTTLAAEAARDDIVWQAFLALRARLHDGVAQAFSGLASKPGASLPFPAKTIAILTWAVANGLGMEQLAEPEAVEAPLLPRTLEWLLA